MTTPATDDNYAARVSQLPARVKVFAFFLILFVLAGSLVFGGTFLRTENQALVATEPPAPLPVETIVLEARDNFTSTRKFTGVINAQREAVLSFSVAGRLEDIFVVEGQKITKGQKVAAVDMRTEQARLNAALAQVRTAQADFDLAQTELDRQNKLQAAGHISQQRVDSAKAALDVSRTRVDAAKSNAQAIRVAIGLGTLTAPFEGVVTRRFVDEGASIAPTAPIIEIVEVGQIEVVLGLPVSYLKGLVPGQTYTMRGSVGDFSAVFRNNSGIIDRQNRTVKCYFDVVPSETAILGDAVTLTLTDEAKISGFLIPREALTSAQRGLWAVFGITTDGDGVNRVELRPIEVLYTEVDRVFVRGAISDGDQIVTQGVSRLVDGQKIDPRLRAEKG